MKVLIVGCGAVGQVFGLALQKAGVELGLYDRPETIGKLKEALGAGGLPVSQVTRRHRAPVTLYLDHYRVVADEAEARRFQPDQVWFATPSQVYYTDWFREFLQAVPSARVACFIPEGRRAEFIPEGSRERLVFGGTTLMAWQGDLEGGGGRAGGVNFWLPPLAIPLVGTHSACRPVAQLLKQAGFRVTVTGQGSQAQAATTALMTAFMAGLELSGWSLAGFRRGPWLKCAAAASRQAVAGQLPRTRAFTRALLSLPVLSAVFRLVARLLPVLVPFEVEKYLRFHYTKTRQQSLALLEIFIRDGERRSLSVEDIRSLLRELQSPA